jgi:ADP-heptose:LPS heptosyltransferase
LQYYPAGLNSEQEDGPGAGVSTRTAIIQAKRGIGDVIWHLPFVRAIASVSSGGKVTFMAPPTSSAKDLLAAEPSILETILKLEKRARYAQMVVSEISEAELIFPSQ